MEKKIIAIAIYCIAAFSCGGSKSDQQIMYDSPELLANEVINGNLTYVKIALNKHPNLIKYKDKFGNTLLHMAAYPFYYKKFSGADALFFSTADFTDIISFLIKKGSYVNEKNNGGFTPLHLAARFEPLDIDPFNEKAMNSYGIKVNKKITINGVEIDQESIDQYAFPKAIINILSSNGANINAICTIEGKDYTVIEYANLISNDEVKKILVEKAK